MLSTLPLVEKTVVLSSGGVVLVFWAREGVGVWWPHGQVRHSGRSRRRFRKNFSATGEDLLGASRRRRWGNVVQLHHAKAPPLATYIPFLY